MAEDDKKSGKKGAKADAQASEKPKAAKPAAPQGEKAKDGEKPKAAKSGAPAPEKAKAKPAAPAPDDVAAKAARKAAKKEAKKAAKKAARDARKAAAAAAPAKPVPAAPKPKAAAKPKRAPAKTLRVTQIASPIGREGYQRATLKGLGLNKLRRSRILEDTPAVRGMVERVKHLVRIEAAG